MDAVPDAVGRPGPAGHLQQRHEHALAATGGARRFDVHIKRTNMNPGSNRRGSNEELVISEIGQVGTQFDAFNHQTIGSGLYNCYQVDETATRTGFTKLGVDKVGALMTRGVLIDVAASKGVEMLPDAYEITAQDRQEALKREKLSLQPGDAVIINTGWGRLWGKENARYVQRDGSFHAWVEDRGPHSCLMTLVDDATGTTSGRFEPQETIGGAVAVLRRWIEQHGIPRALYTDWKNVYVRQPNAEERVTGTEPLTQFGRMCAHLGIRIIPASSPQAKDRIERNHGTHQDRLVKKLRRRAIADAEAANAFVETEYWAEHNRRFAQRPASSEDFYVPVPRGLRLDTVFRLETERTVSNDWVVRDDNRLFQLERQSGHAPARSRVLVCEAADGQIAIRYRDRVMRWTEITAGTAGAVPAAVGPRTPMPPRRAQVRRTRRWRPSPEHPWRRDIAPVFAEVRAWQVADRERRACGSCRSRGRTERAHRSLENSRTVFHSSHRRPRSLSEGDISIELRVGTFLTSLDSL